MSSLDPRQSVESMLNEGLKAHGLSTGAKADGARLRGLVDSVGLPAAALRRYPHEFSGGQRQRIGIARALCVEPDLIVADEPVSALDVSVQAQVLNLLDRLQRELGLTYLVIAHDLAVVRHVSDRVGVMYLGGLVEEAPSQALYDDPQHPYTRALLSAVPVPDPEIEDQPRADPAHRRPALAGGAADRLPVPHPLPVAAADALPRRAPGAASGPRRRSGAPGGLPLGRGHPLRPALRAPGGAPGGDRGCARPGGGAGSARFGDRDPRPLTRYVRGTSSTEFHPIDPYLPRCGDALEAEAEEVGHVQRRVHYGRPAVNNNGCGRTSVGGVGGQGQGGRRGPSGSRR